MGRLSQYVNSKGGGGDYIQVSGIAETDAMLGRLMTSDPYMADYMRKELRKILKEARKNLQKSAKDFLENDPRKAYRAVKFSVYKQIFGGNLSILQKRRSGAKYELKRQRKLDMNPRQRGGNRVPHNKQRNRLDYYYGADRGFILRFQSSGTKTRTSRIGDRGYIRRTDWFGHTAPWLMLTASEEFAQAIAQYIKEKGNG